MCDRCNCVDARERLPKNAELRQVPEASRSQQRECLGRPTPAGAVMAPRRPNQRIGCVPRPRVARVPIAQAKVTVGAADQILITPPRPLSIGS
jgi:hypothetical protein